MLDDQESQPENPIYEPDETPVAGLPSLLRNWQVIEIEGEATEVEERPAQQVAPQDQTIPDHLDDVIVTTLDQRRVTVEAGTAATLELTLCNKGDRTALFQIFVDGWIDERWVTTPGRDGEPTPAHLPLHVLLHPGERAIRVIIITPPQSTKVAAGDHPLAVVVRAPEYPQRFSRLSALLVIKPYVDFSVGQARPQAMTFSWFKRTAHITVPVTNRSNCATTFRLQGADTRRQLRVEFRLPVATHESPKAERVVRTPTKGRVRPVYRNYTKRRTLAPARKLPSTVTLQPGQTAQLPVIVTARNLSLFGLQPNATTVRMLITPVDKPGSARSATVEVDCKPLFRPWHVGALLSFFLLALVGAGAMLLMGFLVLRASQSAASQPITNQIAAPPVITIMVNLPANQPNPLTNAPGESPIINALDADQNNGNQPIPVSTLDPAVPLVLPAQISAPGDPAPNLAVAPVEQPASAASIADVQPAAPEQHLTYQQMFRAIGRRYDLSWRMLAAQAYIESSFDSVALGDGGAMGLMQIMPNTWREWAPVVEMSDPFDSYSNALVAAVYLDYLRTMLGKQGRPEAEWMLVAYNWGIDKVLKHLEAGLGWDELPPESRQYALDILQIAATLPAN